MVIQVGDSTAAVKQEISDLLDYVTGDGDITSWLNATNRINEVADLLGRDGIADGMAGATARARINALWDGPVWAPGADLAMDFREGLYYRGAVTDTHATDILALGSGGYETFGPDELVRTDLGLLTTVGRTNKCENWNANPTDLTGLTTFDTGTGATFEIVDDTAAILASPLSSLLTDGTINGQVIKVTPGTSTAGVNIRGEVGNTNPHTISVFARTETGGAVRINMQSDPGNNVSTTLDTYSRISLTVTPVNATRQMVISSPMSGIPFYFILNQLEEGPFATDPIITEGSAVTRPGNRPRVDVPDGPRAFVLDMDLLEPKEASKSNARRALSYTRGDMLHGFEVAILDDGKFNVAIFSEGAYLGASSQVPLDQGVNRIYGVASDNYLKVGSVTQGDGSINTSFVLPTGVVRAGFGFNGRTVGNNSVTYMRSRRFAEIRNITDPEAAFAQAKALAQEWAAQ